MEKALCLSRISSDLHSDLYSDLHSDLHSDLYSDLHSDLQYTQIYTQIYQTNIYSANVPKQSQRQTPPDGISENALWWCTEAE